MYFNRVVIFDFSLFHFDMLLEALSIPPQGHLLLRADLTLLAEDGNECIDSCLGHHLAVKGFHVSTLEHDHEIVSVLRLDLLFFGQLAGITPSLQLLVVLHLPKLVQSPGLHSYHCPVVLEAV
ncbi:hypothetical protein HG530_004782 [Fusarium avenaceum]|nr:hypothetical protein HG530_004782 [Fusarium avenaceum]